MTRSKSRASRAASHEEPAFTTGYPRSSNTSPLIDALIRGDITGYTTAAEELIKKGRHVNTKGYMGQTPLMFVACRGNSRIVKMLIDAGAKVNAVAENGETALMLAAAGEFVHAVGVLLEAKANPNLKDHSGLTALMKAAKNDCCNSIELLIANKADMEAKTPDGHTALLLAAQYGVSTTLQELIKANANFNAAEGRDGWTALMFAARREDIDMVRILLEAGADATLRSKEKKTASEIAETCGYAEIALALKESEQRRRASNQRDQIKAHEERVQKNREVLRKIDEEIDKEIKNRSNNARIRKLKR